MTHLETFLDCLKLLPNEFQRGLLLIQHMDKRAADVQSQIEALQEKLFDDLGGPVGLPATLAQYRAPNSTNTSTHSKKSNVNDAQIESQLAQLRRLQQELVNLHNEKLAVSKECKDMIAAYNSRLDEDIELFKSELPPEILEAGLQEEDSTKKKSQFLDRAKSVKGRYDDGGEGGSTFSSSSSKGSMGMSLSKMEKKSEYSKSKKDKDRKHNNEDGGLGDDDLKKGGKGMEQLECYCICNQPSYGEMVGCDNDDCTMQWFHFECVGLKTKPKGKWYCDNCRAQGFSA